MTVRIINSDVMDGLRSLPDESVDCVVIELNQTYAAMSERRIASDRGGLLDLMEAAE